MNTRLADIEGVVFSPPMGWSKATNEFTFDQAHKSVRNSVQFDSVFSLEDETTCSALYKQHMTVFIMMVNTYPRSNMRYYSKAKAYNKKQYQLIGQCPIYCLTVE